MKSIFSNHEVQHRAYPTCATHNFYIYGEIGDTEDYVDLITVLDLAQENDTINLYINTPGGSLNTAISLIHAFYRCKGNVICHGDGEITSAGSLIFFAGHYQVVYPYTYGLMHDGSYGAVQETNRHLKHAIATSNLMASICHDVYGKCFSEDEIEDILNGDDCHIDADEILKRLEKMVKDAEKEKEVEVKVATKPKPKPKKKPSKPQLLTE